MKKKYEDVEPYAALARIYDRVMDHVDYSRWVRFLLKLFEENGHYPPLNGPKPKILESACGTGTVALHLALRGYEVFAFDYSPGMIEIARAKSRTLRQKPSFKVMGFEDLSEKEEYDIAICLYDSLNYLLSKKRVTEFLRRVQAAIKSGGYFLFDICTEVNSRIHFSKREEEDSGEWYTYKRKMKFIQSRMIQENIFEIKFESDPDRTFKEVHQQRIYTRGEIEELIDRSGLQLIEMFDGFERRNPDENSLRIHFLCRKPLIINHNQ